MPSASVHSRPVATATRLIDRHGRDAELLTRSASGTAYDPSFTEESVPVVVVDLGLMGKSVDGTLIKTGDVFFLIDASTEPLETMRLRDTQNSKDYEIVDVERIAPGTKSILYTVHCRL